MRLRCLPGHLARMRGSDVVISFINVFLTLCSVLRTSSHRLSLWLTCNNTLLVI
jgi:hypothetical protein